MTDEKSLEPGQLDHKTREILEENGQLNLLGNAEVPRWPKAGRDNRKDHPPSRTPRGLRRPRQVSGQATTTDDSPGDLFREPHFGSSTQPDDDHSRPTGISDLDDVLDRDILFNLVDTPMLDDESLHATVEDVESSLQILADDDVEPTAVELADKIEPSPNDPMVLVKRRRNAGQPFAELIPAPLPVEHNTTDALAVNEGPTSQQAIEDVAHDAVQLMSRSIDAAGGAVLNLELAREIRINLTELLSEWQIEQLARGAQKEQS